MLVLVVHPHVPNQQTPDVPSLEYQTGWNKI
jgi:hypothetical protein